MTTGSIAPRAIDPVIIVTLEVGRVASNAGNGRASTGRQVTKRAVRCRIGRPHPTRSTGTAYGTDSANEAVGAPRPIVARLPAAASHPRRPAASPPGPPQAAAGHPRGLPSPDPGGPGRDPGRGRRRPRAVRDGAGHRGHPPAQAGPPRAIRPGRPGGPGPHAHAPPGRAGGGRAPPIPRGDGIRPGPRRVHPPGRDGSRLRAPRDDELAGADGPGRRGGASRRRPG